MAEATTMAFVGADPGPSVAAVDQLYRAEASATLGMLVAFVGDRALAEDLLHEAFVRVQRAWPRLRQEGNAAAYLRTTAFNLARSGFRRRVVALRYRPDRRPDASSPEDGLVLRDDQRAVLEAVRSLPTRQRECVLLRYYAEAGIDEIAGTLGVSVNSVKTHLRRALDHLEQTLEDRR